MVYLTGVLEESPAYIGPMLVLIAGILTSFLPCSLSSIPLLVGYIGFISGTSGSRKLFPVILLFVLGQTLTFTLIGVGTALLGRLLTQAGPFWYIFLGVLLALMSLQVMEAISIVRPKGFQSSKRGLLGAFSVGLLGGVFASPCATPILIAISGIVASSGKVAYGVFLMLFYSLGANFLVVLSGLFAGLVNNIIHSPNYVMVASLLKYLAGFTLLLASLYFFWLGF